MKKYKLIKEYPGSSKIGKIVEDGNYCYSSIEDGLKINIAKEYVENNPEFWEEIVEKDYEILSFIWNYGSYKPIYTLKDNLYCHDWKISEANKYNQDELLNNKNYLIYSVKRKCDGEIFTINDNIYNNCRIYDIIINEDNQLLLGITGFQLRLFLNEVEKSKQPLFKTEDGVNIHEGDEYWIAHDNKFGVESLRWKINDRPYQCDNIVPTKNEDFARNGNYRFSTKEKAEEYILMNKPCLSINDLLNISHTKKEFKSLDTFSLGKLKLKNLVKSKL